MLCTLWAKTLIREFSNKPNLIWLFGKARVDPLLGVLLARLRYGSRFHPKLH